MSHPELPSWDEIVERHSDRVYRLAYRLTGNRHDAEDLTQEVFVRVFRRLETYTPGTFEGWLHRITTNLFLDQARRRQRIRFDTLSDERARSLLSALPGPHDAVADRMFDDDVEDALAALPPDFRVAVVLCDVEGLPYDEIADILGAKLGTVRSRIHRGRAMLRRALAHRAPQPGREELGEVDRVPAEQRQLAESHDRDHPEDVVEAVKIPERVRGHAHGRDERNRKRLPPADARRQVREGIDTDECAKVLQQRRNAGPEGLPSR